MPSDYQIIDENSDPQKSQLLDPDALCENAQSFEHAMASPMNLRIFELGHMIEYDGSGDSLHRRPS